MFDAQPTLPRRGVSRVVTAALVLALIVGLALRIALLAISARAVQPSTDESIRFLQAQSIRSGATPLLFMAQPYLFPLESYLIAPFIDFFPRDSWGVRAPMWVLQLLALGLMVRFLWRTNNDAGARFCGTALLLIPSSYVLLIQGAYSMPGYAAVLLAGSALFMCAAQLERQPDRSRWLAILGFVGGLAFAGHQLSLVFFLPCAAFAFLLRPTTKRLCALLSGAMAGLVPYILARIVYPGSHAAVEHLVDSYSILPRLWSPTLTHTLPCALGWRITLFPDERALPSSSPLLEKTWPWLLAAGLAGFVILFIASRLRRGAGASHCSFLRIELRDLPGLAILLNLLLFAASRRADSSNYRYLLPAAFLFPLFITYLIARVPRARSLGYAVAVVLLIANLAGAHTILTAWRAPDFADRHTSIPDLRPALDYLRAAGIRHAIASHGAAYRINLQSGGEIVCAQPYNERFPNWPIPFEDAVWQADRIAYVLTDRIRFLKPALFAEHLASRGIDAVVHTAGAFRIFHDFSCPDCARDGARLQNHAITVVSSRGAHPAANMIDGSLFTIWTTTNHMNGGEWIEARWDQELPLERVVLLHGRFTRDAPLRYFITLLQGEEWRPWPGAHAGEPSVLEIYRGHPRYGRGAREFRFNGYPARGIRIEVADPRAGRNWSIAEIEIYSSQPPR